MRIQEKGRQSSFHINARILALENKIKDRKKGWFEWFKEMAGLLALLIAVGYSFPLGLWQEFHIRPESVRAKELETLKLVLSDSMSLLSDTAKSAQTIMDPEARDLVTRAGATKLLLMMSRHEEAFIRRIDDFTSPELIAIGLNFQYSYDIEKSTIFFNAAMEKSVALSLSYVESSRQLAKTLFFPSKSQDIEKGRKIYSELAEEIQGSSNLRTIIQEITVRGEWGILEMMQGDYGCGVRQVEKALELLSKWQNLIGDQGNMSRLLVQKRDALASSSSAEVRECNDL